MFCACSICRDSGLLNGKPTFTMTTTSQKTFWEALIYTWHLEHFLPFITNHSHQSGLNTFIQSVREALMETGSMNERNIKVDERWEMFFKALSATLLWKNWAMCVHRFSRLGLGMSCKREGGFSLFFSPQILAFSDSGRRSYTVPLSVLLPLPKPQSNKCKNNILQR